MQLNKIALADTRSFSSFFLDYIQQDQNLQKFYQRFPKPENFKEQIEEKQISFSDEKRKLLVNIVTEQYKNIEISEKVKQNIASLSNSKTFTITTGHQLNIFTGPLYFIYKIVTVINTCKALKALYPEYNFVPVYWMATEDHDYDEIKYFRLYGKKYVWQTDQAGAVGRFNTKGFDQLLNEIPGDTQIFKNAYLKNTKLSDATRQYVNDLFANEGLVVVDADNRALKSLLKDVIKDDLTKHSTKSLVDNTDKELESLGYKTQVFCRDINIFYLQDGLRNRIEKQNDTYNVVDTNITFTAEEIINLVEAEPEKFSPNVILRPLYQEIILPNLAYIGGPAEVVYWLQLKSVFEYFKTPFPILMPRNFAMVMEQPVVNKFQKTKLDLKDLFEEKNALLKHWVLKNSQHNLKVDEERGVVIKIFEAMKNRAAAIDQTLTPFVSAEEKRTMTSLQKIETKLIRAEKRFQSDKVKQIEFIKDALFPNGSLQERTDNFLNFYQQDPQFIQKLLDCFDPFDFHFNILLSK
jgi:bacillithiol biosynthesis cysteine-adding enzyme BshC